MDRDLYEIDAPGGDDESPHDTETMCMLSFAFSYPEYVQGESRTALDANGEAITITRYTITDMAQYAVFRESFMVGLHTVEEIEDGS